VALTSGDRLGVNKPLQFQDLPRDGKLLKLWLNLKVSR
jgi:hypothetical protein